MWVWLQAKLEPVHARPFSRKDGFFLRRSARRRTTGDRTGRLAAGLVVPLLAGILAVSGAGVTVGSPMPAAVRAGHLPDDSLRIVDDRGDTLRLARPARRIVSLIPAATEILFALEAGGRVVGRTRYGVHPPAARDVPSVGEGIRPSVEAILARRPDAVVVYAGSSNQATLGRLRELGVPVLALEHNTLGDFQRNAARLGRLTGRVEAADSLRAVVERQLGRVADVTGRSPRRSVYYEVWADPPITVGGGSYLDSLITLAGGRNVFGEVAGPSPQVSLEAIVTRRPEVVILGRDTASGGRGNPPAERSGWQALSAVREGRVREVDGALLHRLGPRVGEAAAALAAAIHPELASSLRGAGFPVEVR